MTTAETTAFALYTHDAAWITRHHGVTDDAGRVIVQVPADQVERVTLGGSPALRHHFTDRPKDMPNASVRCPAIWAEAPEVTARRPEALDGKALFLARMSGKA